MDANLSQIMSLHFIRFSWKPASSHLQHWVKRGNNCQLLGFQVQLYSKSPFCKSSIWSPEIKFWLHNKKTGQTSKQTKCNKHKKRYYTYASMDSVTEPIWFTFSKRQLQAFFSTAILMLQSRNKISTLNILQIWINAKIAVINLLTLHIWYSPLAATHFLEN